MRLFTFISTLVWSTIAIGQQLHFQNFNVQNGLPQSQVYALENGVNGQILIGTQGGGLASYNGNRMEIITRKNGLSSHYINDICLFRDELYLATAQGLNVKRGEKWVVYDSLPNLSDLIIFKNHLWIGSDYGLFELKEDKVTQHDLPFYEIQTLVVHQGDLICGGPKGIYNVSQQEWISQKIIEVSCLVSYKKHLWVGTHGSGLYRLTTDLKQYEKPLSLKQSKIITTLYSPDTSKLYIGTMHHGGFIIKNQELLQHLNAEQGLSNNHVKSFLVDHWGGLWIGTSGGGLQKYVGSHFKHMTRKNGIHGDFVYSVYKDQQEQLWLGTENGFQKQTDTGWVYFDQHHQFSNTKVKCFYESPEGTMWVGTDGKGLIQVAQDTAGQDSLIFYTTKDGLSSNWIRDIIYHPVENRIYIATLGGGLTIAQRAIVDSSVQIQFKKLKDPNMPARINQMALDQKGRIWLATDNEGLLYWINEIQAPAGNENLASTRIRSLTFGQKHLWIGTATKGLFEVNTHSEYLRVTPKSWNTQLTSSNIYQVLLSQDSTLWIGSEKGLDKITNPTGKEVQINHFGYNDGFTGLETCQNAVFEDSLGRIYFGTISGLEIYSDKEVEISADPPKIQLKDVLLFYQPISKANHESFSYDENHFGFNFEAIFLPQPTSVQFQWRLKGYESEWSPWSDQTSVNYSNLKPGTYTFEVRAISTVNQQESAVIAYTFSIIPPFWQKPWFRYSVIGGIIVLIILIILLIVLRIKKRNKVKLEQLSLEKDLITLEQKALRLQMNPHFIFNVLNSIQYMIGQEDPQVARYQLAKFSKLMRKILDNSRKNLISIEDELQTIEDFIQIESFASTLKIHFSVDISDDLPQDEPLLPPMILQPFVENAMIHGFDNTISDPTITMRFQLKNQNILICEITDNGIGRKKAKEQSKSDHKSTALEVTQERLDKINQESTLQSLEIIDVPSGGTKVIIRLKVDIN